MLDLGGATICQTHRQCRPHRRHDPERLAHRHDLLHWRRRQRDRRLSLPDHHSRRHDAEDIAGSNAYTGATSVTGGTLTGGSANAFSANSLTTVASGGTVNLGGFAQTINTISLTGGAIQNGSLTGAISSTGGAVNGIGGSASLTTTAGNTTLTTLTGSNAYTGATSVTGGTLTGGSANAFSANSLTTVASGGTVNLGGFAQTINTISLTGGAIKNGSLTGAISPPAARSTASAVRPP